METHTPTQDHSADDKDEPIADESLPALAFTAFLFAVGATFLIQSLAIRTQAAVWPRGLAVMLVILTGVQLAISGRRRWLLSREISEVSPGDPQVARGSEVAHAKRRWFTAGWLLAYCLVAKFAGFGPTMLVFMPVYMWVCDFRRPLWIAAITVGSAICVTLLFELVANVPIWDSGL